VLVMSDAPLEKDLGNQQGSTEEISEGQLDALNMLPPACPSDDKEANHPDRPYRLLLGSQIEPEAGYWTYDPRGRGLPRVVPVTEVRGLTEDSHSPYYVPPYPRDRQALDWEIAELKYLQDYRNDPSAISGTFPARPPASVPAEFRDTTRDPISDFIQLDPPPFGAIFNIGDRPQYRIENINQQHLRRQQFLSGILPPVVWTGRQLARMFENETPGLVHRNALNYLLYKRNEISPPRQARIWMALDVAIYSALIAAWYYKWAAPTRTHSYRQRPYEYDQNQNFRVLFDDVVGDLGRFDRCARPGPCPSPGTPRHPAYTSGHSTFSAAASKVLAYFFPEEESQLTRLANNIGTARLWAGVHWRSDHIAGQRVGRAVGELVIRQLQGDPEIR
jgi:membrane-associated phospholipid phosphatase